MPMPETNVGKKVSGKKSGKQESEKKDQEKKVSVSNKTVMRLLYMIKEIN